MSKSEEILKYGFMLLSSVILFVGSAIVSVIDANYFFNIVLVISIMMMLVSFYLLDKTGRTLSDSLKEKKKKDKE
ncbi:hypothetical protein KQ51_01256 [Candidatus Izimaplasma bacterium HR1]|uniref:hypothetical protein n=1 Tax=Candidatus Izimoplasma sp. HR1 TaxID=1541959 RepID=UPI0004F77A98|nr:hypothetical protein KQ51_01256 [Candidatus Izimaplasma bacterium HR1]